MYMMRIETEEGFFWTTPHETDPDLIIVASQHRSSLLAMVQSIELAGVSEGNDYDDLAVYRADSPESTHYYELVLDRTTLALWFSFEVHHYQQSIKES